MIRGYHVYKDVWTAVDGELLQCRREPNNIYDPFAVSVVKDGTVVGHLPRKCTAVFSLFLRRSGTIVCRVNGSRRYSVDLPQGGLEVPCTLFFSGEPSLIKKIMKLTNELPDRASVEANNSFEGNDSIVDMTDDSMPPPKKKKLSDDVWICWENSGLRLTMADRETVVVGEELNDMHIDTYQKMLKALFPGLCGLSSPLKVSVMRNWHENFIQVYFCRGNHWFTASTIGCCVKEVKVYDSLYNDIDLDSKAKIQKTFCDSDIKITSIPVQKQIGVKDCGLFALAFATFLAFGKTPPHLISLHQFEQSSLRKHYLYCMECKEVSEFD